MKRIALLTMILFLGTAVFAAPKAAPKAAPAKAPVTTVPPAPGAAIPAPGGNALRVGALTLASPGGLGSIITIGTRLGSGMSGDLGLAVGQNAAGANTNVGVLARLEFDMPKVNGIKTHAGGNLMYASNPAYAAAATSSITLNVFGGVEYELLNNFSILADLTILEVTSSGGATSFGLGAGTAGGTGLGTVAANLYCGGRLYL